MKSCALIIDNYDSFTYNLVQAVRILGAEAVVRRNDKLSIDDISIINPTHVIISPGPGRPENAGLSMEVVKSLGPQIPVLGVCLGLQAIAVVYGGSINHGAHPMHGKASMVYHDNRSLFEGLPNPFPAGRYHSLQVCEVDLPDCLTISAYTSDGVIMGVRHRHVMTEGVQFHPESILTPDGSRLLQNFLRISPMGELV